MATYRYRAAGPQGAARIGAIEAASRADALARLRASGLVPIEAVEAGGAAARPGGRRRISRADSRAAAQGMGELAVLLDAGLSLDRAMTVVTDTMPRAAARAAFAAMAARVKEGASLSRAMADAPAGLFPPSAPAMAEAGEASGALGPALKRLADALERADALRRTIVSSLIYPALLMLIALAVVATMFLVVVPQFEGLLERGDASKLPASTAALLAVSGAARAYGGVALVALVAGAVVAWQALARPAGRAWFDRRVLRLPVIGPIVRSAETARFARVLGSLIEGGVAVPSAVAIARRSVANGQMGAAIEGVAVGLKRGGGLSGPLAATGVLPPLAISFLRTGEETARLGPMLGRLADVLDADVRSAIGRALGLLTPALTVGIGLVVGLVIASLMTAILGFNELALGSA